MFIFSSIAILNRTGFFSLILHYIVTVYIY